MIILFWCICAVLCGIIADKKNRNVVGWCVLGLLFGFLSIIILACLPPLVTEYQQKIDA